MNTLLSAEDLFGSTPSKYTLPNGLTVLFVRGHDAGLFSAQVWVKTGSIHEGDLLGSGLSHFVEHMVFKGTARFSSRELNHTVQRVGASMNAYTTFDRTVYYINGPAENAETAFEVLGQMMFHANLTLSETEREREVILREIDINEDDPNSRLNEALLAEAFHAHPYRLPIIGLRDAFAHLSHQQLVHYYRTRYVPNNMVLAVAGALTPETVFAFAEKHFGDAPAAAIGAPNIPGEPSQLTRRNRTVSGDVQVLRGCMAWTIPGMRHADAPALDIFAMILGAGQSSRLHRKIHEELRLVHTISAANWAPGETGLLWLSYTADLGKRKAIEDAVLNVLGEALHDGFTEREFAKAHRACLMAFLEPRKTVHGLAEQLGAQAVIIGEIGYPALYLERVKSLTPEKVLAAVRRHISPDKLTCCAMEPKTKSDPSQLRTSTTPKQPLFEELKLENGMRVLLQPIHTFPKVSLRVMLPGGGVNEPPNKRGLCAMLATMMARDTEQRTASEVAEAAEAVGASLDDSAGNNSIGLAIEVLNQDALTGAELLADALILPSLKTGTFMRELDAQRSFLQEDEDDIVSFGTRRLRELFFGEHPLAVDCLGRIADLEDMSSVDVRALHAKLVRPQNCVLAISGDFDRDAMLSIISERFGAWSDTFSCSGHQAANRLPKIPARTGRVDETRPNEQRQAVVFWAFPDTGLSEDDYVTGLLLNDLLNNAAGQLFTSVREERGMAYFIGSARINTPQDGMFYLYAGTAAQHVEPMLLAMRDELERVRSGKLTPEEIEAGKAHLRTARRMTAQKPDARTLNAALNTIYGRGVNRNEWWEEKLGAQDVDSLAQFTQKYLREEASLIYVVKAE
ncbi:MAG: insulinase family protein [Puniceicoccales bacterium]|jgi:zinc protease|nr:insulinase family protein [Puniceicoccales bacterium]